MARSSTLPALKRELVHWTQRVWERGWVANHDGNLSCRLPGRRYLATPTSFSKAEVKEDDLLVLDRHGKKLQGRWRPFSEISMHLSCYAAREDARAVVHAHPPHATGLSLVGIEVDPTILAEAVVSLGPRVPTLPFAMPGAESQLETLTACLAHFDVFVLGRHGVIALGKDVEQAYLRMELVEHLARLQHIALQHGSPARLTAHEVEVLVRKRTKGGLGPLARGVEGPAPL